MPVRQQLTHWHGAPCSRHSTARPRTSATRSISSTSTSRSRTSACRRCSMCVGLGLTRDPYIMVADNNMWINVGRSQFHLPTGKPQVLRGHTGLVIEGRAALLDRLAAVRPKLAGTKFDFREHNDYVEAICPWGNRYRCLRARRGALRPHRARHALCRVRRAGRQRRRHRGVLPRDGRYAGRRGQRRRHGPRASRSARTSICSSARPTGRCRTSTGITSQIYVVEFLRPARPAAGAQSRQPGGQPVPVPLPRHRRSRQRAARCSPSSTRCAASTHPMFLRPLVNRNPSQTNRNYAAGYEQAPWAMEPDLYDPPTAMR